MAGTATLSANSTPIAAPSLELVLDIDTSSTSAHTAARPKRARKVALDLILECPSCSDEGIEMEQPKAGKFVCPGCGYCEERSVFSSAA